MTSEELAQRVANLAVQLLQTSSYEARDTVANLSNWNAAERGTHVRITYPAAQSVEFRFSTVGPARLQTVQVRELLIPISVASSPDLVYVRSKSGIRAFAKFRYEEEQSLRRVLEEASLLR